MVAGEDIELMKADLEKANELAGKVNDANAQLLEDQKKMQDQLDINDTKIKEYQEANKKAKIVSPQDFFKEELKKATEKEEKLAEKLKGLGEAKTRSDRDFRKQAIMTTRTCLLENLLLAFFGLLSGSLETPLSMETLLELLFRRSGRFLETPSECTYWLHTQGLSQSHRKTLERLARGLTELKLLHRGKPIIVRLRDGP